MYGIFRYLLATFVVFGHFSLIFAKTSIVQGAVFGFYILSGYLMTSIINSTYGKDFKGTNRYLFNRVVRIYPTYWIVLIFTFILILIFGSEVTSSSMPDIVMPRNLYDVIKNIMIFGVINPFNGVLATVRIVPPAWALVIELIFYILIPFLGRNNISSLIWFLVSIIISIIITVTGQSTHVRYHSIFAATLPFSAGSYLYYFIKNNNFAKNFTFNSKLFIVLIILYFLNNLLPIYDFRFFPISFGICLVLSTILIALLSKVKRKNIPTRIYKLDKFLGGLSYPIYLSHYTAGIIIAVLFYNGVRPNLHDNSSHLYFILVLIMTNIIAVIIYVYFESYIQKFRDKIRGFTFN